ncbi:MAG: TatD family hydrolase [Planctomycetota bacterium]
MIIIEPHIHMYSRTTDDYQRMYAAGIRACIEPSFWLGSPRRYAGTFLDYFQLILEFETVRARRFGIDHYAAVSVNPKEAEDLVLAREVMASMAAYLAHDRCVAVGEIGLNAITRNEETVLAEQLELARKNNMPVIIHLPHLRKPEGVKVILGVVQNAGIQPGRILIDHNTEETMPLLVGRGYYLGLTVYPISKLTPERVSGIIRQFGADQVLVNGSADWGVSDPLSLVKVAEYLAANGHPDGAIRKLVCETAQAFYSQSPRFKPELDLKPVDPREFQR